MVCFYLNVLSYIFLICFVLFCVISVLAENKNHEYLCSIDLLGNQIKEIPKEVAKMPKLTKIELGYNQLEEIPSFISTMNLVHFCIQGNQKITKLPDDFGNKGSLRKLHLEGTSIKQLPLKIELHLSIFLIF